MDFSDLPLDHKLFTPIKPAYTTPTMITKPVPNHEPFLVIFPVLVKSMTGKHTTLDIHGNMTIEEMKQLIEKIDGIPPINSVWYLMEKKCKIQT